MKPMVKQTTFMDATHGEAPEVRIREGYEKAADFLLRSCAVNGLNGSSAWRSGWFHPWRLWSFPYPETSGYLIPTFYQYVAYGGRQRDRAAEAIRGMTAWLLSLQLPDGAFPSGHCRSTDEYYLYASDYLRRRGRAPAGSIFNSGQILLGLVADYRERGDPGVYHALRQCAAFLAERVRENGEWARDPYAKDCSPSYFTHVAWPLLEAAQVCRNPHWRSRAIQSLDRVAGRVEGDGFIRGMGFGGLDWAHTHTIGYTLYGLLRSALVLGSSGERWKSVAAQALQQLARRANGKVMPGAFGPGWAVDRTYTCVTGNCQLGLCYALLGRLEDDSASWEMARALLGDSLERQRGSGGLPGSAPIWGRYMRFRYPNWAGKFFMDLAWEIELSAPSTPESPALFVRSLKEGSRA